MRAKGSYICYRKGPTTLDELLAVCRQAKASQVFFNHVCDPLSLVRDHDVKQRLAAEGVTARSFAGELLHQPWEVLDGDNNPFTTFDSFWERCAGTVFSSSVCRPPLSERSSAQFGGSLPLSKVVCSIVKPCSLYWPWSELKWRVVVSRQPSPPARWAANNVALTPVMLQVHDDDVTAAVHLGAFGDSNTGNTRTDPFDPG